MDCLQSGFFRAAEVPESKPKAEKKGCLGSMCDRIKSIIRMVMNCLMCIFTCGLCKINPKKVKKPKEIEVKDVTRAELLKQLKVWILTGKTTAPGKGYTLFDLKKETDKEADKKYQIRVLQMEILSGEVISGFSYHRCLMLEDFLKDNIVANIVLKEEQKYIPLLDFHLLIDGIKNVSFKLRVHTIASLDVTKDCPKVEVLREVVKKT